MKEAKSHLSKEIDDVYKAVLKLKSLDEARQFFRDLLTIEEIDEMARRWQLARLIDKKVPYREIAKRTGVSTATVSRVALWLHDGMGGYRLMLDRINK